jgi:hypothetical protein
LLVYIVQKYNFKESCIFSRYLNYDTSFQDAEVSGGSGASDTQVEATVMLLLVVGNAEERCWDVVRVA